MRKKVSVLIASLALVATACGPTDASPAPATPSPPDHSATSQSAAPLPQPSTSGDPWASKPSPDRLNLPVPAVKPAGFVASLGDMAAYRAQKIAWQPCPDDDKFTCATVSAPLDYDHPDKQGLTLSLKRRAATQTPKIGTLFINPGGPGGSGKELVKAFKSKGLERYDIVGWDPRGVGDSTPIQCMQGKELEENFLAMPTPKTDEDWKQARVRLEKFGKSCLDKSGPLLRHMSTTDTVKDLDLLRELVGDKKLHYFGYSYGTKIGAHYAQLFGKNVGRMGLDGAVNIGGREDVNQAKGFDRAIEAYAKDCIDKRTCTDLGDSPKKVIDAIIGFIKGLENKPMKVGDRELNDSLGLTGVIITLYSNQTWPFLTKAMTEALNGDGTTLLRLADTYNERKPDGTYGNMQLALAGVSCVDEGDDGWTQEIARGKADAKKAPIFGQFISGNTMCAVWPVKPVPPIGKITGPGADPILVVGSTGDSATPYEFAVDMAKQLQSGRLITLDGEGHGGFGTGSKCLDDAVVKYLVDGTVPADGTRCSRG